MTNGVQDSELLGGQFKEEAYIVGWVKKGKEKKIKYEFMI